VAAAIGTYDVAVTAVPDPQGNIAPPSSGFWEDLRVDLRDPVFRAEYVRLSRRINKLDRFVNADDEGREDLD
jgi:hypothetical protein